MSPYQVRTESSLTTWKASAREAAGQQLVSLLYQWKETGASASEGPWPGRRATVQSMRDLEQCCQVPVYLQLSLSDVLVLGVAQKTRE